MKVYLAMLVVGNVMLVLGYLLGYDDRRRIMKWRRGA